MIQPTQLLAGLTIALASCGSSAHLDESPEETAAVESPCGARWSSSCFVEDGLCHDPDVTRDEAPLTHSAVAQRIEAHLQHVCGPFVVMQCPDTSAVARASWGDDETPVVDVFDASTRAWIAGYFLTDASREDDPCGTRAWLGDPAQLPCGEAALAWVTDRAQRDCDPSVRVDTASGETCDVATCVRNDLGG